MFTHNTRSSFWFASSVRVALIAVLLAVGAVTLPPVQTQAASCNAYVASSSYGNSNGYAYSHAVANCSSAVSASRS